MNITDKSLWDELKKMNLPVILYGIGNGADMIIDVLHDLGLDFADVFASDGFVRGHSFHGKQVLTFSQVKEKYEDFVVLITFAVRDEKTLDYFYRLSREYKVYSPTVPIAGKGLFTLEYVKEHYNEFEEVYNLLADERSKEVYENIINFKISGRLDYLFAATDEKKEVYSDILNLTDNEDIVDLGAYDGDTIREFLAYTNGRYNSITAFEPDEKNFRKLQRKTEGLSNLTLHNVGAWDKEETIHFAKKGGRNSITDENGTPVMFNTVDNLVNGNVSFLKMDIEGAELHALEGAKATIQKYKPKLYVCAYHRNEDFFALPKRILEINPAYKIYMRKSPYVPAWESNFYCIDNGG